MQAAGTDAGDWSSGSEMVCCTKEMNEVVDDDVKTRQARKIPVDYNSYCRQGRDEFWS